MLVKSRNYFKYYAIVGLILHLAQTQQEIQAQQQNKNDLIQKLSIRNMNFAFKLYKLMVDQPDAMWSPLIMSMALTMTSFAAGGTTLQNIYQALELNGFSDRTEITKGYSAILKSLEVLGETSTFVSNRVAVRKDFVIKSALRDVLVNHFGVQHVPVHYSKDAPTSTQGCLEQATKFNFTTILSFRNAKMAVEALTPVHLASVIYFNGMWAQPFCKERTSAEEFFDPSGKKQTVRMMNARARFLYAEDEVLDSKILKLDYTGLRFAMYVILPNKLQGLQVMKRNLDAQRFLHVKNNLRLSDVAVKLPKYMGDRLQFLGLDLKNLGIVDLENEMSADLREMAEAQPAFGGNLFAKQVIYGAHVELGLMDGSTFAPPQAPNNLVSVFSESSGNRSSASAFNAVSYRIGKRQNQPQTKEFYANRPFVFIIHDSATDLILFMGNLDNFAKVSFRI